MTSQTFKLDLLPIGISPVIRVSQNDTGQTWLFNMLFNKAPFSVPAGSTVYLQGTKPDSSTFKEQCTFSGNVVTAAETQQMTNVAGNVRAEISIEKDDTVISSLNFIICVEKAA